MNQIILSEAEQLVKELEGELHHARASWAVFSCGNGLDPTHRASLHKKLDHTFELHTFEHIIRASATMTVMSVARLTDPHKADRITLMGLKKLIQTEVPTFSDAAAKWFESWPEKSAQDRQFVEEGIPKLVSKISKFVNCNEIKRIRKLRDEALAHRLKLNTLRPTFHDIGYAFDHANEIVSEASVLLTGTSWDPSDFMNAQDTYASAFWDRFEKGFEN